MTVCGKQSIIHIFLLKVNIFFIIKIDTCSIRCYYIHIKKAVKMLQHLHRSQ